MMISGLIYLNGSVELAASYDLSNVPDHYENQSGPFSVVLKVGNNTIFRINSSLVFRGGFSGGGEETNVSYFVYVVPKQENITSINFIYNGVVQQTINKSANSPHISLQSPLGGETFLVPFNVSWNGSDLDDNILTYLVQISNDGGNTWYTLAVDLNTSYIALNNGDFSYGTGYRLKVLASDGFNTNTTESLSDFTIIPPPRVSVDGLDQVYSSEGHQIFEAALINDGGQDLPSVAWRFNTSSDLISSTANISLATSEELTVIIEHNYPSGGLKNVSLFAFDNNKSVNDTYSAEVFIGDLRVYGLAVSLNGTQAIFQFPIYNNGNTTLSGVNWTLNTGEKNHSSSSLISLSAYNSTIITVSTNYSVAGNYSASITVWDAFNNDTKTANVFIPDFIITDHSLLYQQNERIITTADITNALDTTMNNVSWNFDSGIDVISSTTNLSLAQNETMTLIIDNKYTQYDTFTTTLTANNVLYTESSALTVSILELAINNLEQIYSNNTRATITYTIQNLFSENKTATWTMTLNDSGAPSTITAQQPINITQEENITIIVDNDFTPTTDKTIIVGANTNTTNYTQTITIT